MPKKKYQVIKATQREIPGVYVGGRKREFGKNGSFEVSDAGEAAEINKVLGMKGTGEVVVVSNTEKEHGHNYTFSGVDYQRRGGNERVKIGTANNWTWCSLEVAIEEGYEIIPQKRNRRRNSAEATSGNSGDKYSTEHIN